MLRSNLDWLRTAAGPSVRRVVALELQIIFADTGWQDGLNWMQKQWHLQLHHSAPEFVQGRGIEVLAFDVRANDASDRATLTHTVSEFLGGPCGIL